MESLYSVVVWIHVIAGGVGLATLAVPLVARKGSRLHRRAGWVFVMSMAISLALALLIAASWIAIPLVVKPDAADFVPALRRFAAFFGLLGLAGAHALFGGIAAIGRRRRERPWLSVVARRLPWTLLVAGPIVFWAGVSGDSVLLMAFGGLFTVGAIADVRRPPVHHDKTVLVAHVEAMLGAATVATTAFTVQIVGRIDHAAAFSVVAWMVPVGLGMLATRVWRGRVQRGRYTAR